MTPPVPLSVGFLGLGAIGTPMATHLARRYPLTVWNRTRNRAETFVSTHPARLAGTPAEVAAASNVIITCLPTSAEVTALFEGSDGLARNLAPGALWIDCTSGDPQASRRLAARLAERAVAFADAPVSGGTNGAEAGTLTVMVGAEPAIFARAREVLGAFASRVEHMGPVGTGHAMKAVNNALLAVHILALAEGLAALVKTGVAAGKAVEVLNASSGRSFVSEVLVPERVLTGAWPNTFRLALLEKDVGIAVRLLDQTEVGGPMLHLTGELFRVTRARLGERADYLEAIKLIEEDAGIVLRDH